MTERLFFLPTLLLLFLFAAPTLGQCDFDVTIGIEPMVEGNIYCPGDTVKLSAGEFDSYQWYYSFSNTNTVGMAIDGATGEVYQVDISFWGFAYFYVVATKNGCSEASPPALIDYWAFLSPVVASDGESEFCNGDSTEISVPFGGYVNLQWYQDGEPIAGATEFNYWVRESGTYVIFANSRITGITNNVPLERLALQVCLYINHTVIPKSGNIVIALSFEIRPKKYIIIESIMNLFFITSKYLSHDSRLASIKNNAMISSLDFILATTSVCMGCTAKMTLMINGNTMFFGPNHLLVTR